MTTPFLSKIGLAGAVSLFLWKKEEIEAFFVANCGWFAVFCSCKVLNKLFPVENA